MTQRNSRADFENTARCYVDAILAGDLTRDDAIKSIVHQLKAAVWWEHERIARWLYTRFAKRGKTSVAELRKYLAKVRAR